MESDTKTAKIHIPREMRYPIVPMTVLRKRKSLKSELLAQTNLTPVRIAILGGSTTTEIRSMLELFLLAQGMQPTFYESGYNRYAEDVLFEKPDLLNFKPDVVFLHTTWQNVSAFPNAFEPDEAVERRIHSEIARFETIWTKIHSWLGALIIQNNFDLPPLRPLGNSEAFEPSGRVTFLMRLNAEFAAYARKRPRFILNDILYLSAQLGLNTWLNPTYWYNFHMSVTPTATVALAQNVAALLNAVYGKSKKCLVLDLDNTLWGGVIGDDGVQNLVLGRDHAIGEAYLDFQSYVKDLRRRGVILAVCSKNEHDNAKEGFSHPDSILKIEDFSVVKANWNPKPENIREIAAELNIGLDSIVFVDDSPAERSLVSEQLPEVATPDIGSDVSRFAAILEAEHYFELHKAVQEDLNRSAYYDANLNRGTYQATFSDYGEFLSSLKMTAEIAPFSEIYLERITQLINKTNQFNLTTKRYTAAQVETIANDGRFITLYGRLADKFGDNGLVSVIVGRKMDDATLELDLWLMSCRVLNREMELAMFDALVEQCQAHGIRKIMGVYVQSQKNALVAEHYPKLGFIAAGGDSMSRRLWYYEIPSCYARKASYIRIIAIAYAKDISTPLKILEVAHRA